MGWISQLRCTKVFKKNDQSKLYSKYFKYIEYEESSFGKNKLIPISRDSTS